MGLVIVFLDVGADGWDWVADPIGWVLVLMGLSPLKEIVPGHRGAVLGAWLCLAVSVVTFPPDSVDILDPTLGWLFSLPTIAFSFVLCDALADAEALPAGRGVPLAARFRWLRVAFVVVGVLPLLVYVVGWEWLTIPTAVAAVLTNITLVLSVWAAGDEPEDTDAEERLAALRARREGKSSTARSAGKPVTRRAAKPPAPTPEPVEGGKRKKEGGGFDAEAVKRRVRKEREAWQAREGDGG